MAPEVATVKRALFLALLLAAALVVVALRAFHSPGDQPELTRPDPESRSSAVSSALENHEPSLEITNAASTPSRESVPTDTSSHASTPLPDTDAVLRIKVLYAGSDRPVRAAKAMVEPSNAEARTDLRGVAEIGIPKGAQLTKFRVEACDDGDPFIPFEHTLDQVVRPGKNELLVRVDRGVDLHGIVSEAGTGRVLPGANVRYGGFGYRTDVVTDANGAFLCKALLVNFGNPNPLQVECAGYLPASVKPQSADIQPGAAPLLVQLTSGLTVSGRVVDSNHEPVAGAYLELLADKPHQTISDERGNFVFAGITASEQALLKVGTQPIPPILGTEMQLGALTASRSDVVLEVQRAVEVQVFAELADGSKLNSNAFDVDWGGNGTTGDMIRLEYDKLEVGTPHKRIVPLGIEFEVLAFARAPGADDPTAIVSGSARIRTDAGTQSPHDVHIRLGDPVRIEIPPPPTGAGESRGFGSAQLGAFDVQVLDADSGLPISDNNRVVYTENGWLSERITPGHDGWIRLWRTFGTRTARVQYEQGPEQQVTISIPRSGYAKGEWRLRSKP